jgi:hypothetical protein
LQQHAGHLGIDFKYAGRRSGCQQLVGLNTDLLRKSHMGPYFPIFFLK